MAGEWNGLHAGFITQKHPVRLWFPAMSRNLCDAYSINILPSVSPVVSRKKWTKGDLSVERGNSPVLAVNRGRWIVHVHNELLPSSYAKGNRWEFTVLRYSCVVNFIIWVMDFLRNDVMWEPCTQFRYKFRDLYRKGISHTLLLSYSG